MSARAVASSSSSPTWRRGSCASGRSMDAATVRGRLWEHTHGGTSSLSPHRGRGAPSSRFR